MFRSSRSYRSTYSRIWIEGIFPLKFPPNLRMKIESYEIPARGNSAWQIPNFSWRIFEFVSLLPSLFFLFNFAKFLSRFSLFSLPLSPICLVSRLPNARFSFNLTIDDSRVQFRVAERRAKRKATANRTRNRQVQRSSRRRFMTERGNLWKSEDTNAYTDNVAASIGAVYRSMWCVFVRVSSTRDRTMRWSR